jgi:hypothetical protein
MRLYTFSVFLSKMKDSGKIPDRTVGHTEPITGYYPGSK